MDPGTILAVAELSATALSLIGKYYNEVSYAKSDIVRLQKEIEQYQAVLLQLKDLFESVNPARLPILNDFGLVLNHSLSDLEKLNEILEPKTGRKAMKRFGLRALQWPLSKEQVAKSLAELERRRGVLSLALAKYQTSLLQNVERNQDVGELARNLDKLPYAKGAAFDDHEREHKAQCTNGTREDLLKRVQEWSKDRERRIFWLRGMAGTGKTTISQTVAKIFADQGSLGASFFFARGEGETGHATLFVSTLARQLADLSTSFRENLCKAISANPRIFRQGLRNQWKELILGPLSQFSGACPKWNILVDALDECSNEDDTRLLLQLFMELKDATGNDLCVFVTSRPEMGIRLGFRDMPDIAYEDLVLHEIPLVVVEKDLALFLEEQIQIIRHEHGLRQDWPEQEHLEALVRKSHGLFIFIATACRFLGDLDWDPVERLSIILEEDTRSMSLSANLDEMYAQVLRTSVARNRHGKEKEDLCSRFREIVGPIVVAYDSFSTITLANLLFVPRHRVELALNSLHSLLRINVMPDNPIRLLHPSFRDYILNPLRCLDQEFYIDELTAHARVARDCLRILRESLKKDICNLRQPGKLVSDLDPGLIQSFIPKRVQYACRYWVEHLGQLSVDQRREVGLRDEGEVHVFLKYNFLHWLEVLGLIGSSSEGIRMLNQLVSMVDGQDEPAIREVLSDARRFTLSNNYIIAEVPLQLYVSALLFSPRNSQIRKFYSDQLPSWIERQPIVEEDWSSCMQILEGHSTIEEVAFSYDDKFLATVSADGTIRVWNPETGTCIHTFGTHFGSLLKLAFSYDTECLASGYSNGDVCLWNPNTGSLLRCLKGHSQYVAAVEFSHDNQILASGSYDCTVRLWQSNTGTCTHVLEGKVGFLTSDKQWNQSIAFSRDGYLVWASEEGLRLWDLQTGLCTGTFEGRLADSNIVAFSPDDQLLASALHDKTIRLWDRTSGLCVRTLETGSSSTEAIAFSCNGRMLASVSGGLSVMLWDLETGTLARSLKGCTEFIRSPGVWCNGQMLAAVSSGMKAAFSHNYLLCAVASGGEVRLYDLKMGPDTQKLGHQFSKVPDNILFSEDGQILASVLHDQRTVRLQYPNTNASARIIQSDKSCFKRIAFSHDSRFLASVSNDGEALLWNIRTSECLQRFKRHHTYFIEVAFSNNDRLLATVARPGRTVCLWNMETANRPRVLDGYTQQVWQVAFSSDDQLLAIALYDRTICITNLENGALTQTLLEAPFPSRGIAFSPNDKVLASALRDGRLQLWDIESGRCEGKFEQDSNSGTPAMASLVAHNFFWRTEYWSVDEEDSWLKCNGERAIWLHPNYRTELSARDKHRGLFALGHNSGQVAVIGVAHGRGLNISI